MKNQVLIFTIVISSILVLSGCNKDEENNPEPEVPEKIYQASLINPSFSDLQVFYEDGYNVINGNVEFNDIDNLLNMLTLSNVKTIKGFFLIQSNSDLKSFEGLSNLQSIGGDLRIENNGQLKNLEGINNLKSIGGTLFLQGYVNPNNSKLSSLSGFNNLQTIGGNLKIDRNIYLLNLDGLSNLQSIGGFLNISNNDSLNNFCGIKNLLMLDGVVGEINFYYNGYDPSVEDIINGNCSL